MKLFLDRYKYLIGAAVSVLLLYLAVKDIDWNKLIFYFSSEYIPMVIYVFIINIMLRIIIALRWHKLLDIVPGNKFTTTLNYTNIGYFANNVLPARLGDIIKSIMFAKKRNYSITQVLTSAVIERVFDLAGLGMLFILAVFRYDIPENIFKGGIIFLSVLAVVILITLIFVKKQSGADSDIPKTSKYRIVNFLRIKIKSIFYYLKKYLNFRDLFYLSALTALVWFLYVFAGFVIVERLNGSLGWDASMLSLILLGVSFILPSTPGNIGVHQFACVVAFGILNLDQTQAVAFSFYYQIPVIIISIVLGFISIYYEGFSLKSINQVSKEAKSASYNEIS